MTEINGPPWLNLNHSTLTHYFNHLPINGRNPVIWSLSKHSAALIGTCAHISRFFPRLTNWIYLVQIVPILIKWTWYGPVHFSFSLKWIDWIKQNKVDSIKTTKLTMKTREFILKISETMFYRNIYPPI